MAIRTTAAVLMSASAVALGFAMAGVSPAAHAGTDEQTANRALKADAEFHTNRSAKADRLSLAVPVAPAVPFLDRPASSRDWLHDTFAIIALPQTPAARYAALPPLLPDPEPLPAPKSPLDGIRNPLINDAQIESIRKRLKLTPAQDKLWPAIRSALHEVVIALADKQKRARHGASVTLDPASTEVQHLRTAALPLLAQLRADQKRELTMLARIIGLESALARL